MVESPFILQPFLSTSLDFPFIPIDFLFMLCHLLNVPCLLLVVPFQILTLPYHCLFVLFILLLMLLDSFLLLERLLPAHVYHVFHQGTSIKVKNSESARVSSIGIRLHLIMMQNRLRGPSWEIVLSYTYWICPIVRSDGLQNSPWHRISSII